MAGVTARMKGRDRQAQRLISDVTDWARREDDVGAVALVGSYARKSARMASDVDLVIVSAHFQQLAEDLSWFTRLRPGASSYAHRRGVGCLSVDSVSDLAYTSTWGWSYQPGPSYHLTLARIESLPAGTLSSSTGTNYSREPRTRSTVVPHDDPLAALREETACWTHRKENVGDEGARNRRGRTMTSLAVLRGVDAVTVPVPDLDQGLEFYRDQLGHELVWRNDAVGQVGLRLPESHAELVLSTNLEYAVNWLVRSVSEAVETIVEAGGKVIIEPTQISVGRLAVVNDPFGNALVLLDLSAGRYVTDVDGRVLGVQPRAS
jgi:predicted enzyme related to lactoylglutathione lyase